MSDGPMSPEEYAKFMGEGMDEEDSPQKKADEIPEDEIKRLERGLMQSGLASDGITKVLTDIDTLKRGEQREFNFIRGHVRRVRIRRELNGKITLIAF